MAALAAMTVGSAFQATGCEQAILRALPVNPWNICNFIPCGRPNN